MGKMLYKSCKDIEDEHIEMIKNLPKFKVGDVIVRIQTGKHYKVIDYCFTTFEYNLNDISDVFNYDLKVRKNTVEIDCRILSKLEKALK